MEREKRGKNYSSWALIREVKPDNKDGKKKALKKQMSFYFSTGFSSHVNFFIQVGYMSQMYNY